VFVHGDGAGEAAALPNGALCCAWRIESVLVVEGTTDGITTVTGALDARLSLYALEAFFE